MPSANAREKLNHSIRVCNFQLDIPNGKKVYHNPYSAKPALENTLPRVVGKPRNDPLAVRTLVYTAKLLFLLLRILSDHPSETSINSSSSFIPLFSKMRLYSKGITFMNFRILLLKSSSTSLATELFV